MVGTVQNPLVQDKLSDVRVLAMVYAKYWFPANKPYYIGDEDFVVCEWSDYHDGEKSNIEGMTTIAVCKSQMDAEAVFVRHMNPLYVHPKIVQK